jgi:hypothetical protein
MASDWEILEVVGTEEEAEIMVGYLASQGMPAQMDSAHSHEFPVNVSALGNVRVEVPAGRVEEARRLLEQRESLGADEQPSEGTGEDGV